MNKTVEERAREALRGQYHSLADESDVAKSVEEDITALKEAGCLREDEFPVSGVKSRTWLNKTIPIDETNWSVSTACRNGAFLAKDFILKEWEKRQGGSDD